MTQPIVILPIALHETDVTALASDARREGYLFVDRLVRERAEDSNRFALDGECFLGARERDALVGIGGLNRVPYAAAREVARLRHLYIRPTWRCRGIASRLVSSLIERALTGSFVTLRLRTDNPDAARLYDGLGFAASVSAQSSHSMQLPLPRLPPK